jgi:hypothetical protein
VSGVVKRRVLTLRDASKGQDADEYGRLQLNLLSLFEEIAVRKKDGANPTYNTTRNEQQWPVIFRVL